MRILAGNTSEGFGNTSFLTNLVAIQALHVRTDT